MLSPPAFDAHVVEFERQVVLQEAALDKNNPVAIAAYSVLKRVFPGDPLSQPILGYRKTLERITFADAKAYYGRFYTPANSYALIVGDVEPERAASLVAETLGGWQTLSHRTETFPPPPRVSPDRLFSFRTLVEQVYYGLGTLTPGHAA